MPSRGSLRRPETHPVYQSLEALLRQVNSASSAALAALRIARAHGAAITEETQLSELTAAQLLTRNLYEAVEVVASCASLCTPTAKSACVMDPRHRCKVGEKLSSQDTATPLVPSAKTERRRRQRASRKAKRKAAEAVNAGTSEKQAEPMPPPTNKPFPSWSQVTSEFVFGADTFMGSDAGTLSGEKRSHPTSETILASFSSKRKQVNVKPAKGTSASFAATCSLVALQTEDAGSSLTHGAQGAAPERDKIVHHATVCASAAQGSPAKGETSGDEYSSMDGEEHSDG